MPNDRTVTEITIYRTSLREWCEERRTKEKKMRREMKRFHAKSPWPLPASASDKAVDAALAHEHRGWYYNEAIGWIRVHVSHQQIWGELFLCKERVSINLRHKNFELQGKVFEIGTFAKESSTDIFNHVCQELDRVKNERWCRGRHIDIDAFLAAGAVMDWRTLTGLEA